MDLSKRKLEGDENLEQVQKEIIESIRILQGCIFSNKKAKDFYEFLDQIKYEVVMPGTVFNGENTKEKE